MSFKVQGGKVRLTDVRNAGVRTVGEGGPAICVEMGYLGNASSNRRMTRLKLKRGPAFGIPVLRHDVRRWMDQLAWTVRVYAKACGISFRLPLLVTFQLVFPSRMHLPDVHNFHKAVCDALQDGLGINDQHMMTRDLEEKIEPGTDKRLVVTVTGAEEAEA